MNGTIENGEPGNHCVCSDCPTDQPLPHVSPFPMPSLVPETHNFEMGQLITLHWLLNVQVKRGGTHLSL